MSSGCSKNKKSKQKYVENYQMSPCLQQASMDYVHCSNGKDKKCMEKKMEEYKICLGSGMNFMFSEPGYRQATKGPCPFEYPSKNIPRIPFV